MNPSESTGNLTNSINRQITGLSDIFASPSAINRCNLPKKTKLSSQTIITTDFDAICRICHSGTSVGNLLRPCNCKGTLALIHLKCLQHWLIESNRNYCELCNYHYCIIREPKYNRFWSIIMFLCDPGHNWKYFFVDLITLIVYTPTTMASTYMLMILCDNLTDYPQSYMVHMTIFATVFGIATITFTYISWLVITLDKYTNLWTRWYKKNCNLKIVFSHERVPPESILTE